MSLVKKRNFLTDKLRSSLIEEISSNENLYYDFLGNTRKVKLNSKELDSSLKNGQLFKFRCDSCREKGGCHGCSSRCKSQTIMLVGTGEISRLIFWKRKVLWFMTENGLAPTDFASKEELEDMGISLISEN